MVDPTDKVGGLAGERLETAMTIRGGKTVYDRDGRAFPVWSAAGQYEVIP